MRRQLFICLFLAGITLAIYWPVRNYGIVYYDDPLFVTENAEINSGLNWHSLWWALSGVLVANWHPVTSLSFVVTHTFWGANPGAEHLVNVLFHTASAVLLFLVLNRMTRAPWRSAVVAAIFAWHPLRVESVAWISERKDVLSVFFMMLTLWAWVRYAQGQSRVESRESSAGSGGLALGPRPSTFDYYLALIFFALGLMSKPMLVTVPFVLLLLDYWPLGRISEFGVRGSELKHIFRPSTLNCTPNAFGAQLSTLLLEKWPFFALSAIFSGLTYALQKSHAAVVSWERLGWTDRISNAVSSYLQYLVKLFWPAKLAVIYPYPKSYDALEVWLIALLLAAVSVLCVCQIKRRPYLAVGWFWYLGTALPIIGLVQVGEQAMANRYTYIPLIGPVISLVWLVAELGRANSFRKYLLAPATVIILVVCVISARWQVQLWENTVTLCEHTIAVTTDNPSAQFCLGVGLEQEGRPSEAMVHYRIQAALSPLDYRVHYSLARAFGKQGRWAEAIGEYNAAAAMGANPDDYIAHLNLADALSHLGRTQEAVVQLDEALRIKPDSTEAMNNLAWTLATSPEAGVRDGKRAVELAERACTLTDFKQTIFVGTLAAAYAEAGRFDDAVATSQTACALATAAGETDLLKKNQELLNLYQNHQTYRDSTDKPGSLTQ
jgi:tetratricopeptide (TPR) repeat protein